MNTIKHYLTFIGLIFAFALQAQVTKTKYLLKYNETSCLWEVNLVVEEGSATSALHRAQFNAQISFVLPKGASVDVVKLNMPLQHNQNYTGTNPMNWAVNNFVGSPAAAPNNDFVGLVPVLNPTSFYNNLKAKDTVLLFTAQINGLGNTCGEGVRLFENGKDPDSNSPGMNGGDFSNGFTMGSVDQIYQGNLPTRGPSKPIVKNIQTSCADGLSIKFSTAALACHGANTYKWVGPNGFTASTKDVLIPNATDANSGEYKLFVSDALGCKDTVEVRASAAPGAGQDGYVSCATTGKYTLMSNSAGTWSVVFNESAGSVNIAEPNEKSSTISGFTNSGWYTFKRDNGQCTDFVKIYVDNKCNCTTGNYIEYTDNTEFCGQSPSLNLTGNDLGAGSYQWIYKKGESTDGPAPGLNIFKNFTTQNLQKGTHSFRRIFKSNAGCADTSQAIVIYVKESISAGSDSNITCYQDANTMLSATGEGYWIAPSNTSDYRISSYYDKNPVISHFAKPGKYAFVWTNDICSDTVVVDAQPFCGCSEAKVVETVSACKGEKIVINGSCPDGTWSIINADANINIDSTKAGNAYVNVDWAKMTTPYKMVFSVDLGSIILKDTATIVKRSSPNIDLGFDFDYCRGTGEVILSASGATGGFKWSNGATTRYILVEPAATTSYSVIGQNQFGCSDRDTVVVRVHEKPKGQIPASLRYKVGDQLTINTGFWTDAIDYVWDGPNGFHKDSKDLSIPNLQMSHNGVYTLTILSQYDCYSYATVNVIVSQNIVDPNVGSAAAVANQTAQNRIQPILNDMVVYPNPAISQVTIDHPSVDVGKIEIRNTMGMVVSTQNVNGVKSTFDIMNLVPGMYVIMITDSKGFVYKKPLIKIE